MASDKGIERLQMAVVDGRTENIRYRQGQFHALHAALRAEAGALCEAMAKDSQAPTAEVETEFYLAMETVRHFYDSLSFDEEHKKEYSVTHGKDNRSRRLGVGLVVIRPTSHTRLYSIISPLAAALAAGNCIILELQDTLLQVDAILRKGLAEALDINTFYIGKAITDASVLERATLVDQNGTVSLSKTIAKDLPSASTSRVVAFVDRTADVEAAAKAITAARFSFGGTSPYAPDLVLVNEFVKDAFFEACSKYATQSFAAESAVKRISGNMSEETRKAIKDAEAKGSISSFGSNDFKLIDVLDRSTSLIKAKVSGRYLPIASTSGLVDAAFGQQFETPLLAGYFFAESGSAKYLAHHTPCHMSFLNQIPAQLLVGPAAPTTRDASIEYRYSKDMFSVSRPQVVEAATGVFAQAEALLQGGGSKQTLTTSALRAMATKPLKPTGQPKNENLGFFETGFLSAAGIALSVILPVLGYTTWVGARKMFELASRLRH